MNLKPTIQIGVADDHAMILDGISSLLQKTGKYNVHIQATHGMDLLAKISQASWQPDVCLIDVSMPIMDGADTITHMADKFPFIKCIALTMMNDEYNVRRMYRSGAMGYVMKNVNPEELYNAIDTVYDGNYYFSDAVRKILPYISQKTLEAQTEDIFTEQELTYIRLNCDGLTYKEIGQRMSKSERTVEKYFQQLRQKLNLHSREELASYATRVGIK